jgi:DNA-binding NarL/FixJ family response regulator
MLNALCDFLKDEPGEVEGTVADGVALVDAAQRLEPDVIIIDISVPRLNGLDATRVLQKTVPRNKVIILTVYREPVYAAMVFAAGAHATSSREACMENWLKRFCT